MECAVTHNAQENGSDSHHTGGAARDFAVFRTCGVGMKMKIPKTLPNTMSARDFNWGTLAAGEEKC